MTPPKPRGCRCAGTAPDKAEAKPVLDSVVRPHATILVKASRGMALEELVEYLLTITKEA